MMPRFTANRLLEEEPQTDRREDRAAEESEPSLPDRRPVEADRRGLDLPGEPSHDDQDRGHAGAEREYQPHAGGQAAQGGRQHQQAHRVPAGNQATGQSQSEETEVAPLDSANRPELVLAVAPQVTPEPPEAGRRDPEASGLCQPLVDR